VTKATGTVAPRLHLYNYGTQTWTHANSASTAADGAGPASNIRIGHFNSSSYWQGNILIAGVWDTVLTDTQIEALITGHQAWIDAAPKEAFRLDKLSGIVSMAPSGTSTEVSRVGTTVDIGDAPAGWVEPSFSKGTAVAVASGTTVSPTLPPSIEANDILILVANSFTGGGSNNTTFTDPSGWTRLDTNQAYVNQFFAENGKVGVWWKRAAGGESGTVSVVRGGTTTEVFHAQIYRFSGMIATGSPVRGQAEFSTAGTSASFSSLGVLSGDLIVGIAVNALSLGISPVVGTGSVTYTERAEDATSLGSDSDLELFTRSAPADGSYIADGSPESASVSGWWTMHLGLIPVGAPPPPPPVGYGTLGEFDPHLRSDAWF
jgi:hypothetical protein